MFAAVRAVQVVLAIGIVFLSALSAAAEKGAVAPGILIYGVRAPSPNTITLKICNLTGGVSPAITNLPFRVFTFG